MRKELRKKIQFAQSWAQLKINGNYYDRIPFGEEIFFREANEKGEKVLTCPFCLVSLKSYHRLGCVHDQNPCDCPCRSIRTIDCKCPSGKEDE